MAANTSIQWTDKTWNPLRGCSVVSPGCHHCYAMKLAHRFSGPGQPYEGLTKQTAQGPQWTGKVREVEEMLREPLRWRKPARVFVNSMSDLFHEGVSDAYLDRVFAVMACAPQHTFQILTKRAERMRDYCQKFKAPYELRGPGGERLLGMSALSNVWLGVSVEDQRRADERIPLLLQTPAAVRWISAEPLLGPVDLWPWLRAQGGGAGHCFSIDNEWWHQPGTCTGPICLGQCCGRGLDWCVVGGESGPGARPFHLKWGRSIVQQCRTAGVPVFMKQIGSHPLHDLIYGPHDFSGEQPVHTERAAVKDRKGGDPLEWPEDLRVREFPRVEVPV